MATLLLGYDVEYAVDDGTTPRFLESVLEVHARWDAPMTLFLMGQTVELNPDAIRRAAGSPLVSVGQHTYSHRLFKHLYIEKADSVELVPGGTLEQIEEEVARTNDLIRDLLGVECTGLTAPYTYHRGLRDRPDVLAVLERHGIRFVRADGRDSRDYQPAPMTQPYWYTRSGFPGILEMPTHGWHDNVVREDVLGWDDVGGYVDLVRSYIDRAAEDDLVYSVCAHDWSSVRADPGLEHVDAILRHARSRDVEVRSYHDVYAEHEAARRAQPA